MEFNKLKKTALAIAAFGTVVCTSTAVNASAKDVVFDSKYYADKYSDLKAAFGYNEDALRNHFYTCGIKEGRQASMYFNVTYYLENNEDLKKAFNDDYQKAFNHFITFGYNEGRITSKEFNAKHYLASNADLKAAFGNNEEAARNHYVKYGYMEKREISGHTEVVDEAVAPTCTTDGKTEGSHCSVCGEVIKAQEVVPVKEHVWETVKAATCTEDGIEKCAIGGEERTIEKLGHDFQFVSHLKEATCTEGGIDVYECSRCSTEENPIVEQRRIEKTEHVLDEGIIALQPTCDKEGIKVYTCQNCDYTKTEEIAMLEHHFGNMIAYEKAPTCTENGMKITACDACVSCQERHVEEIPATGHTENQGEVTKPATCSEEGVKTFKCSKCGEVIRTESIAKLSHTPVDEGTVTKEPTCKEEGIKELTCCECGETYVESIPQKHNFLTYKVIKEANSCKEDGVVMQICIDCNKTQRTIVPAKEHTEVTDEAVAPTCTTEGKTEGSHCSVCGEVIQEQETIPATGHTWNVTKPATCTETGTRECTVDGCNVTEEIPATGHKEVTDEAVAPTCTTEGKTEGSHCSVCGEVIKLQEKLDKVAHKFHTSQVDPTETENGYTIKYCEFCGLIEKIIIPATGKTEETEE